MVRTGVPVRVRRLTAAVLAVLVVTVVRGWVPSATAVGAPTIATAPDAEQIVVVGAGDTLWSIAIRIAANEEDPRPLVDALAARNRVADGYIFPGQTLIVP